MIPLFDEEDNIEPLLSRLLDALTGTQPALEVILVDDGSRDRTWPRIQAASARDSRIKGLSLARNFGHQSAIFAGLHYCSGKAIVTMDGDLQHPPEMIPRMVAAWREGNKIVETRRIDSRDSSLFKRHSSRWFYRIFELASGLPLAPGSSDFRLIDAQVAAVIKEMRDADLFLRGIARWIGYPKTTLPFEASPRHAGKTKYSLLKMIKFAVNATLSFSLVPLKLGIWLGFATSLIAFCELVYILIRYFQGATVPGWTSTLTVISFMFGILFILLGIIGLYLGNICEILKNRPRFLVNETAGFDSVTHKGLEGN